MWYLNYIIGLILYSSAIIPPIVAQNAVMISSKADAIVLQDQRILSIKDEERAEYTVERKLQINNEKGAEYASLMIQYNTEFNKLTDVSLTVVGADGELIRKLKKKDFEDRSLSGDDITSTRVKVAEVSHHRYPYTVTQTYTREYKGYFFLPHWRPQMSGNVAVEQATFLIDSKGPAVHYKLLNGMSEPDTWEEGDIKYYKWDVSKLPLLKSEPYAVSTDIPGLLIAPAYFAIDDYKGENDSWESFGKFIYELNKDRDALPESLKKRIHEMTQDISDVQNKIAVLYEFLQRNTRYVSIQLGIGGWQTFTAAYVHENGYGDCKALTNYMKGMLNVIDIPAHMALISVNRDKIYNDFPCNQFDHMILCIPNKGDTLWLECTSNYNPMGYLGNRTYDKEVLVITSEGGKLTHTPVLDAQDNLQTRRGTITIDKDGSASAHVDTYFTGYQQGRIRSVANSLNSRDQENWLKKQVLPGDIDELTFSFTSQDQPTKAAYVLSYKLRHKRWAKSSGNRLFLSLNTLEPLHNIPPKVANRTQPVVVAWPYLDTDSIHYIIPPNYQIEAMSDMPIKIQSDFGMYHADILRHDDGSFTYIRKLQISKTELPPESYTDFREFWQAISQAEKATIVLSDKS